MFFFVYPKQRRNASHTHKVNVLCTRQNYFTGVLDLCQKASSVLMMFDLEVEAVSYEENHQGKTPSPVEEKPSVCEWLYQQSLKQFSLTFSASDSVPDLKYNSFLFFFCVSILFFQLDQQKTVI